MCNKLLSKIQQEMECATSSYEQRWLRVPPHMCLYRRPKSGLGKFSYAMLANMGNVVQWFPSGTELIQIVCFEEENHREQPSVRTLLQPKHFYLSNGILLPSYFTCTIGTYGGLRLEEYDGSQPCIALRHDSWHL